MTACLISVIGPPASGKTTLAELLAAHMPAELIREDYEGNPFLADSYAGPREARLPAQLHYLLSRVNQLSAAGWPREGLFVSDYGFCQDRLYALARLSPGEMEAYDPVHERFAPLVHAPELLVHLDASESTLLERIARRGRRFEKVMTRDFLSSMRRAYNGVVRSSPCPVVTADCDEVDPRRAADLARLIEEIRRKL